jgi:hypothetical protein
MTCNPSNMRETHAMGAMTIMRDAASVLKGLPQRHFEEMCAAPVSRGILSVGQHRQVR